MLASTFVAPDTASKLCIATVRIARHHDDAPISAHPPAHEEKLGGMSSTLENSSRALDCPTVDGGLRNRGLHGRDKLVSPQRCLWTGDENRHERSPSARATRRANPGRMGRFRRTECQRK